MSDPLAVGLDRHPGFDPTRARWHQGSTALNLDHAHPANVDRSEGLQVTESRLIFAESTTGIEQGRPFRHDDLDLIDRERYVRHLAAHTRPLEMADRTTDAAVCPRPQMEASLIARSISSIRPTSMPPVARATASSTRTVPTRQGTH